MKLKILYYLAIIVLFTSQLWATNTNPIVTNVAFSISGTTVTVHYNVTDAEQSTVTISMEVSSDGGTTWNYNCGTPIGDIGAGVTTGTAKTITWTYTGGVNNQFQIRIIANDLVIDGGPCATATVVYSGKTYHTVQIGSQCWLKENLDVGTMIPGGPSLDQNNNGIMEKYCYNDDPANCTTYGGLYQWAEAVQYKNGATTWASPNPAFSGNVQGICPTGWHIPTNTELQTLETIVNNDANSLKAGGTNTSGFSALMGGYRSASGSFRNLGIFPNFSCSTEFDYSSAYLMSMNSNVVISYDSKGDACSVRCLKD